MEEAGRDKGRLGDAVARLVEQISAAELASASISQDSPNTPSVRSHPGTHTPVAVRSKSPMFSTRYKQNMMKEMRQQKAVRT